MERSVENAQKMVKDMLKDHTQTKLSETTGINQVTLANLKNAKAKRITDKVWNRLEKAYDSRKAIDTVPMPEKPKKRQSLRRRPRRSLSLKSSRRSTA